MGSGDEKSATWECRPLPRFRLAAAAALAVLAGVPAVDAARSPYSRAREVRRAPAPGDGLRPALKFNASETVFDVVVSLYREPDGDGNPNTNLTDSSGKPEEQTAYEEILRYFADGVCEQSNGVHRVGTVRIFTRGRAWWIADIVWSKSQHPDSLAGGWHDLQGSISFGDNDPQGFGAFLDQLGSPRSAGYALAHEWGHYVYKLQDEYRDEAVHDPFQAATPRDTDTPAPNSIMNNQARAANDPPDLKWLNHSTENNFSLNNAQGRYYGRSGWDVLASPTSEDPTNWFWLLGDSSRTQWTNLAPVKPTAADNWFKLILSGPNDCRDHLDIRWIRDAEIQVVVDRSGSMQGERIANAKQAAKALVDVLPGGRSAVGLVSFASNVTQDFPIFEIPGDIGAGFVRGEFKRAVDQLDASGSTALFDAALTALRNLQDYQQRNMTNGAEAVFVLSDGGDSGNGATETAVLNAYKDALVPLITIAFGAGAPSAVLRRLAAGTGGLFFSSGTSLADIQRIFLAASTAIGFGDSVSLASGTTTAPGAGPDAADTVGPLGFVVDSTVASFIVLVNHLGAPGDVTLGLSAPAGPVPVTFDCAAAAGATGCSATVDAAAVAAGGVGSWTVEATSAASVDVNVDVVATPKEGQTFNVTVGVLGDSTVTYPEPIQVAARIGQAMPITGVDVRATVTDPQGTTTAFAMNDAGVDGDLLAGDGTYSALLRWATDGVHTIAVQVDNAAAAARFTAAGRTIKRVAPAEALPPVTENFTRTASTQVTTQGKRPDDHPDTAPGTPLAADNTPAVGTIDFPGDADVFGVSGIDPAQALVMRVARVAFGMDPVLTVYLADGVTEVASATRESARTRNDYLALVLEPARLDPSGTMVARITHRDGTAAGGLYSFSAGPGIASDAPPDPCAGLAGFERLDCQLAKLLAKSPCGADRLKKSLRRQIRQKAKGARRVARKAARAKNEKRRDRQLAKVDKQLGGIAKKVQRAARKKKPKITSRCRAILEALVGESRALGTTLKRPEETPTTTTVPSPTPTTVPSTTPTTAPPPPTTTTTTGAPPASTSSTSSTTTSSTTFTIIIDF